MSGMAASVTTSRARSRCHRAEIPDQSAGTVFVGGFEAELRQPAPHADPMEQRIEPEGPLDIGMIESAVALEDGFPAARIFMCRTEERLCKIEELVRCPRITEIDKPTELKSAWIGAQGQHIALMKIVVAEDGTAAFPQEVEASFCQLLQTTPKIGIAAEVAEPPEHILER